MSLVFYDPKSYNKLKKKGSRYYEENCQFYH